MKRNLNVSFLEAFVRLDVLCSQKFGVKHGGVTEYINRLSNTRFAPRRDEVLPMLVKYRNIRNVFAHEATAIKKNDEISKADLTWINKFSRDLNRKKDPISKYLKKAKRYMRGKRIKRYIAAGAIVLALFVGAIVYFLATK